GSPPWRRSSRQSIRVAPGPPGRVGGGANDGEPPPGRRRGHPLPRRLTAQAATNPAAARTPVPPRTIGKRPPPETGPLGPPAPTARTADGDVPATAQAPADAAPA